MSDANIIINKMLQEEEHQMKESMAEDSSNDGGSVTDSSSLTKTHHKTHQLRGEEVVIAQMEDNAVSRLRAAVIFVLLVATIGVSILVYFYVSNDEKQAFEEQFHDDSLKTLDSIGTTLDQTLGAIDAFAVNLVSYARAKNQTWPFVTIPDYAVRVAKLRSLSKAVYAGQYQVVQPEQRAEWEAYSVENDYWVNEGIETQANDETYEGKIIREYESFGFIHNNYGISSDNVTLLPAWQGSPVIPIYYPYNWNGGEFTDLLHSLPALLEKQVMITGAANTPTSFDGPDRIYEIENSNDWIKDFVSPEDDHTEPFAEIDYPIVDTAADSVSQKAILNHGKVVSIFSLTFYWRDLIKDILPQGSNGIIVVFEKCNQTFSYQMNGPDVVYLGPIDAHDSKYDHLEQSSSLLDLKDFDVGNRAYTGLPLTGDVCPYNLRLHPSQTMEDDYVTSQPIIFAVCAAAIFVFTAIVFFVYDRLVERRQTKVMKTAVKSSAIISSLFPSNVRDRLFEDSKVKETATTKNRLTSFLRDGKGGDTDEDDASKRDSPIADLFLECTVMFADIEGFTSWSSMRDPGQVFALLEALYGAFDYLANRRGVFKVETIGDSYVAVTGLPEPRKDHAAAMVRFARDCRVKMNDLTRKLEVSLGPDTGDLTMRFGLHSGPVTAGVLRSQNSRFQLFGDTVNTAARMESTGFRSRIHVSQATADILIASKKGHWLTQREELVEAKGKGKMQTYWCEPSATGGKSICTTMSTEDIEFMSPEAMDEKTQRLVDWNVEVLAKFIRDIIARRNSQKAKKSKRNTLVAIDNSVRDTKTSRGTPLAEVKEIIELPEFDASTVGNAKLIELDEGVMTQLQDYVAMIAATYKANPFHNFDHASHVGMSVAKLLARIVAPDRVIDDGLGAHPGNLASSLHDHTYGITSDPLTQFACVFAALIHDVDHSGVPNTQLVKENAPLATLYGGKSVAEQNSVDISWDLFLGEGYSGLRNAICPTLPEMRRFRQLIVNSVMATDIMDKDLKTLRNARWERAFSELADLEETSTDQINRKATIVIEHLIQASDVAHTMQHWHVYRKWNECLFREMYAAYQDGRGPDPSVSWYEGELGFFDFYIIPLAKKLSDCGVFGVSSDEYLNYALKNREEWECRGQDVVAVMLNTLKLNVQ